MRNYIAGKIFYFGFWLMTPGLKRGIGCIAGVGLEWAKANEVDLQRLIDGKEIEGCSMVVVGKITPSQI